MSVFHPLRTYLHLESLLPGYLQRPVACLKDQAKEFTLWMLLSRSGVSTPRMTPST